MLETMRAERVSGLNHPVVGRKEGGSVIGWFDEAGVKRLFSLPIKAPPDSPLLRQPNLYRVVFIGKTGDWPIPEAREEMVRDNGDTYVVWIAFPPSLNLKVSFFTELILPSDQNNQTRTPIPYFNPKICEELTGKRII